MRKIKVVIAEDHEVVRQGLKVLLRAEPDFEVAGEAEDGIKAIALAAELHPDVILMDLAMPRKSGFEATQEIARTLPSSKVLVLSSYGDDELILKLIEAGAAGYITKHSASEDLLEAIRQVSAGRTYFSPMIRRRFQRKGLNPVPGRRSMGLPGLTPRETEVLRFIAAGLATKEIAERMGVSTKTVEKHRQAVMDKLNIHEIAGLTRYAASKGLVSI